MKANVLWRSSAASLLICGTVSVVGFASIEPSPAFAAGGAGGPGVAGGVNPGDSGQDAPVGSGGGGGGGGPGAAGGTGGGDFSGGIFQPGALGGAGGITPGADGEDGDTGYSRGGPGGGGGGGGAHGIESTTTIDNQVGQTLAGGKGGNGGKGGAVGYGGGGGAGGYGAVLSAPGRVSNAGTVTGGDGGNGATHDYAGGGDGGAGVLTGDGATVTNQGNGLLQGGAGGWGFYILDSGKGGSGLIGGNDANVTNLDAAAIVGGNGGSTPVDSTGSVVTGDRGRGGDGGAGIELGNNAVIFNRNAATIAGGDGGDSRHGDGGKGGSGISVGLGATIGNSASITGGDGGNAGSVLDGVPTFGGAGGAGVSGSGLLTNTGTITGGNGGAAGGASTAGQGGEGVSGSNLTIINSGTISGGFAADGLGVRANAISFTGGVNHLELHGGFAVNGNVVAAGMQDTLALGGAADGVFDASAIGSQYQGFEIFEKTGSSTWRLTGATDAVTPWIIAGGTLSVSSDANLGDPGGSLTLDGGTLQNTASFTSARQVVIGDNGATFLTDANLALAGAISGDGLFNKSGAGTLTLSGTNSYTGGTRILAGTLEAAGGHAIGDASSVFLLGGNLRIQNDETIATLSSGDTAFGNVELAGGNLTVSQNSARVTSYFYGGITGSGGFIKDGTFRQVLAGDSSYTGATQILAGTLFAVGAGRDSIPDGSAVTIAAGATLSLVRPTTVLPGVESDDETIGSLAGAGTVLLGGSTLTVGADGTSTTFSGLISGTGGLTKTGAGALNLTGDNSGFSGPTSIEGGTLRVNGNIGGNVGVETGGTLGGSGTIGGNVSVAGVIAPGNSIGTLTVDGDYVQLGGSTYVAEIDPAGNSDLIDVGGVATIEGGTVFALKAPGGYAVGTRYTILTADDGVTGTFGSLTQNAPFVSLALIYDPGAVYLDVTRNQVAFCDVAATRNQCATGQGAESLGQGNAVYDAIAGLPDSETARAAFDQLSGEVHASIKGAMLEDSRFVREAATARVRSAFEGVAASPLPVMAYGDGGPVSAPADIGRFAVWA
ncbi:autotransporter-associated beta strand repeat-containing protein [Mesorhizobium sp. WSM4904]|uniref:beta strand repeat-containing protein n=1 Tax=Mesorhizobium sp. WSM4904 TaxID=3038545 RepID=UPI002418A53C|nr:autotransporter-associated beta strand repeat-containing protein [Mesorhizobium sp. WSM4904]WFP61210.1 autotransporter-associated beta strand repeat-containing protein [Mesorhizobium sp. WSM4904]